MGQSQNLKGVQKVLGCLATLSRFILQLGEKGLALYLYLAATTQVVSAVIVVE
jgi:hypothetical protein